MEDKKTWRIKTVKEEPFGSSIGKVENHWLSDNSIWDTFFLTSEPNGHQSRQCCLTISEQRFLYMEQEHSKYPDLFVYIKVLSSLRGVRGLQSQATVNTCHYLCWWEPFVLKFHALKNIGFVAKFISIVLTEYEDKQFY